MKFLNDYIQAATTQLFNELGIFFAFNKQQLEEGLLGENGHKKHGKYSILPGGMYCPHQHVDAFIERYDKIINDGIALDIAENGAYQIIRRELDNYEYGYTHDLEPVINALASYGFSVERIKAATHGVEHYKARGFDV